MASEAPSRPRRTIGGPPRKLPTAKPAVKRPAAESEIQAQPNPPAEHTEPPVKTHDFAIDKLNAAANGAIASDSDSEDEQFEEVDMPAQAGPSRLPDDEQTGGEAEGETDDSFDLEAVYGYDFHSAPSAPATDNEKDSTAATPSKTSDQPGKGGAIEVTLGPGDGLTAEERNRKEMLALRRKPLTARDRALRLEAHKLHVVALLANASVRNKWLTDDLLKSRLLSLAPHELHAAFHIPPSRYPDPVQRSRLFLAALQELAIWWANEGFEVTDTTLGIRTRSWDEIMDIVDSLPRLVQGESGKGKGKQRATDGDDDAKDPAHEAFIAALGQGGERIRTVKSLMKKALQGVGGRDTSAQLFVALCRSMGLGARLVVSLQPVQWKSEKQATIRIGSGKGARVLKAGEKVRETLANVEEQEADQATQREMDQANSRPRGRRRGKVPDKTHSEAEEEDDFEEVDIPSANEDRTPGKKGRGKKKQKSDGGAITVSDAESESSIQFIGSSPAASKAKDVSQLYRLRKDRPKKLGSAPKVKPKKKKVIDLQDQPPVFWAEVYDRPDQKWIPVDPVRGTIKRKKEFEPSSDSGPIRMIYVVAFEEDGSARDVTVRYAKNFGAKTVKLRVPVRKDEDWWERLMTKVQRRYRLNRDELEDAELATSQISEGMPMVMSGFKDHPLYVLERHLKREEVIQPKREVGKFRGEAVYRRANVVSCKTPENWMRIGRKVKFKEEPLKWVKQRAVTIDKRRAAELAEIEGKEPLQQGLYAEWQTELYRPPPIRNGQIPMNAYGNIDLYVPSMLPQGAAHLPYKGIAKVAKQLGVNFAEACTGFEFKKRRAIPIITGIVVPAEQEEMVLEAYWESAAAAEERALSKKQEKAISRWKKLIKGIQIRSRLQEQYGDGPKANAPPRPRLKSNAAMLQEDSEEEEIPSANGGFLPEGQSGDEGGGAFLPEGSPVAAGGFVPDDEDLSPATGGGGFMPDDAEDSKPALKAPSASPPAQQRPQTRLRLSVSAKQDPVEVSDASDEDEDAFKPVTASATRGKRKRAAPASRSTATTRTKRVKTEKPVAETQPSGPRRRSTRSHAKTEAAIRRSLENQEDGHETDEE